jgi:hypothetical protein
MTRALTFGGANGWFRMPLLGLNRSTASRGGRGDWMPALGQPSRFEELAGLSGANPGHFDLQI